MTDEKAQQYMEQGINCRKMARQLRVERSSPCNIPTETPYIQLTKQKLTRNTVKKDRYTALQVTKKCVVILRSVHANMVVKGYILLHCDISIVRSTD